eukprot:gene29522-39127_t
MEEIIEHRGDLATRVNVEIGIGTPREIWAALEYHRSQLCVWQTKPPSVNELKKAGSNILRIEQFLTEFNSNYSALVAEVTDLKLKYSYLEEALKKETASRENFEDRLEHLQHNFDEMKLQSERQTSVIRVFDLIRMYRFYVLQNVVGGDWGKFCEEYFAVTADVEDKIKSQEDLNAFLKP